MSKRRSTQPFGSLESKRNCLSCEQSSFTSNGGWQASLGYSLADRLEQITSVQNLTTRQVKRLLRDVLTNEDVVDALRRYINGELREPETGELSASTKRRAKNLGLFGLSSNSDDTNNYHFESRAITRSLTRRIQQSLREQIDKLSNGPKQPRTILDMNFPDETDFNRCDEDNHFNDTDYQPDIVDLELLKRDLDLELNNATNSNLSSSSRSSLSSDTNSNGTKIRSQNEDDTECSSIRSPHLTRSFSQRKFQREYPTTHLPYDETSLNTAHILPNSHSRSQSPVEGSPNFRHSNTLETSHDNLHSTNLENPTVSDDNMFDLDQDDEVYAAFLRSLFSSTDTTPTCTPNKDINRQNNTAHTDDATPSTLFESNHPVPKTESLPTNTHTVLVEKNPNEDDLDDPDDPEFDVMAEMDQVNREDFFYELRDDRAVRVSKLETKHLHEDLCELFNEDEDDPTCGPGASSVLVMKARVQRFFPNENEPTKSRPTLPTISNSIDSIDMDSETAQNPISPLPTNKSSRLDPSDLTRLQRQLGMHIQLLATNFFLTFDFPDLRATVTTPCSSFLRAMACRRDTFDLMALQQSIQSGQPKVTSFYWKCKVLDQAIELISNYAGLTMVPWVRDKNLQSSAVGKLWNPNLYDIPLPHCLLRLMTNSPVWSYAYLMPKVLSSHSKISRRFNFHPSEDALLLMGLANYSGALVPFVKSRLYRSSRYRKYARVTKTQEPKPVRYLTYRLIGKNMLPHRSLLQLRSRRWNLLGNMGSPLRPNACSIPTHRLLRIFTDLGQTNEVDMDLIQRYANEMASLTFVHSLPVTESCLTDRPTNQLFTVEKLPTHVGYEVVLNPSQTKNETCRKKRDIITDFVENAQCLWRSRIKISQLRQDNSEKACTSSKSVNQITIKTEDPTPVQPTRTNMGWNVLGPTFLPAIPVDVTSDGNLVLSRNANPTVVQIDSNTEQSTPMFGETTSEFLRDHLRPNSESTITDHIEFVLKRIRNQLSAAPQQPRKTCEYVDLTSEHVSSDQNVVDKPTDLETRDLGFTNQDIKQDSTMANCQETVDCLNNIYHIGLDKIYASHGENHFGPRKFHSLFKPGPLNPLNAETDINTQSQSNSQLPPTLFESASSQALAVFPSSCFVTPGRFITRCRARGDASTADFITLPNSILLHRQAALDELDVRRARSLLDRCRTYLSATDYESIMSALSNLHQLIQNHVHEDLFESDRKSKKLENETRHLLSTVLYHLRKHRPLWEDFVYLLTPEQARLLGLLPTYLNLIRTARVQRVLQDLVPRGKRFWRLLRNLADSCGFQARNIHVQNSISRTVIQDYPNHDNVQPVCSNASHDENRTTMVENRSKSLRPRGLRLRGRSLSDCVTKAWSVLESSWRNRPILLSNVSNLLNTRHKPYSNFEQSFEELDVLSRHPLGASTSSPLEIESLSDLDNHSNSYQLLPNIDSSSIREGWEVCTEISSGNYQNRRGSIVGWNHRQCPCKCHPNGPNPVTYPSGKPAKVDSLGLRHCISCSLRVHQGIVYVDECNFHLRQVHITWPPGFKPKSNLHRSQIKSDRLTSNLTTNHTNIRSNPTTQHTINSNPIRITLAKLVESLKCSTNVCSLPDMANRSVAIEFLPSDPKRLSVVTSTSKSTENGLNPTDIVSSHDNNDNQNTDDPDIHKSLDNEDFPFDPKSNPKDVQDTTEFVQSIPRYQNSPFWDIDDEAACFNTEAFANEICESSEQIYSSHSNPNSSYLDPGQWTPQEDRQLLEYCKARGYYSSSMFADLAQIWKPMPRSDSIKRNASELENRFKHLMLVTLGDAYDPQLFQSPCHVCSASEDEDEEDENE